MTIILDKNSRAQQRRNVGRWIRILNYCMARSHNVIWANITLGANHILEIDEKSFSKKHKYHRGNRSSDRWGFGMIERGTNLAQIKIVPDRNIITNY